MKRISFLLAVLALLATHAIAQQGKDTPTEAQVLELLEVSGSRANAQQSVKLMLEALPTGMPNRLKELLVEEMKIDSFLRPQIALHQQHYTAKEVADLIAFYKSPLGKKVNQVTPLLMEAGMQNGRGLGERAAQRAVARFQAEQAAEQAPAGGTGKDGK